MKTLCACVFSVNLSKDEESKSQEDYIHEKFSFWLQTRPEHTCFNPISLFKFLCPHCIADLHSPMGRYITKLSKLNRFQN